MTPIKQISSATVRDDFNDPNVVVHYARAAHELGLWASERLLVERWLPDRDVPLLDVGCGAGRAILGLWDLGYRNLTGVDFADELLDQARSLAVLRGAGAIRFLHADATRLSRCHLLSDKLPVGGPDRGSPGKVETDARPPAPGFAGALFLFNGLMQIPGREQRRRALREIGAVCQPAAPLIFTSHDRNDDPRDRPHWLAEAGRWAQGEQDPRLMEFGDRYFRDDHGGNTFMHLPTRTEVMEDLAAVGWTLLYDAMRRKIASESRAVRDFSDECRFWVARRND